VDIQGIGGLVGKIKYVPRVCRKFHSVIEAIGTASEGDVDQAIAATILYSDQLMMLRIVILDHRQDSFDTEVFPNDIVLFHEELPPFF
jgi:hypothetical protein